MIRYTVVWHDKAQAELAQIWLDSTDREVITQASHAIETILSADAHSKGVTLVGEVRELANPPLVILFAVSEPDRLVRVLHAKAI